MTETGTTETSEATPWKRFAEQTMRVARLVDDGDGALPRGDVAALRREDGARSPAFYKLAVLALPEVLDSPRRDADRDELERRWARVVHLLASSAGLHARGGSSLGAAIAATGVAEARFLRLLRAEGGGVDVAARTVLSALVQKATPFDPLDLAALVLSAPHATARLHFEDAEAVRRRVARDYYRAQAKSDASSSD